MSKPISENISEKPARRGRPEKFGAGAAAFLATLFPGHTKRGINNRMHSTHALQVLNYAPEFHWLTATEAEK